MSNNLLLDFSRQLIKNMSKEHKEIEEKVNAAENELRELEKFIYKLETNYFSDTIVEGNITKGWEPLLNLKSSKNNAYLSKKQTSRNILDKDRIFSLSSCTLPTRINDYEARKILLPSKHKLPTSSKTLKRPTKRTKASDTDDYSEGI